MHDVEERCLRRIKEHEQYWWEASDNVRTEALYRLEVDSIYDYVDTIWDDPEDTEYLWRDAVSVLKHIESEWGYV